MTDDGEHAHAAWTLLDKNCPQTKAFTGSQPPVFGSKRNCLLFTTAEPGEKRRRQTL